MAFTSTKVPKFSERLVGISIDAFLMLLSGRMGGVKEVKRATWAGLAGALAEHYGSPGRLADYRRQFERTTRQEGEDTSILAIALETVAVKAFGGMGSNERLHLIRDRFIAGHENCALRWHLDSVSPETPIRDIVD